MGTAIVTNAEDKQTATGRLAVELPVSVVALAAWSAWTRFDLLPAAAPRRPGVYLAATTTGLVYVGISAAVDLEKHVLAALHEQQLWNLRRA